MIKLMNILTTFVLLKFLNKHLTNYSLHFLLCLEEHVDGVQLV